MGLWTQRLAVALLVAQFCQQAVAQEYSKRDFLGLNLGVGVALTVDASNRKPVVESASVINGIVRVDEERNASARIILESHYFFKPEKEFWFGKLGADRWGHGPFLAVQPGDSEIINAIGFGWMMGFRRGGESDSRESWNVGFGALIDPSARVLGDGIKKNEPLPQGETDVRFKTEAESSLLLIFSFSY